MDQFIPEIEKALIHVSTSNPYHPSRELSWEGIFLMENIRSRMALIEGVFQLPDVKQKIHVVRFRLSELLPGSDSNFLIMGCNVRLDSSESVFALNQHFQATVMTWLAPDETEFLRRYRIKPYKTEADIAKYQEIQEKIRKYQLLKVADFQMRLSERYGAGNSR